MNALRSEQEGFDVAATAPTTIAAVKAGTVQEHGSDRSDLAQADRAGVREASVTYRYPWSIDEQSAHRVDRPHLPRLVERRARASAVTVLLGARGRRVRRGPPFVCATSATPGPISRSSEITIHRIAQPALHDLALLSGKPKYVDGSRSA